MSTVLVVAPILVASWPALSAAVTAAVASLGYVVVETGKSQLQGQLVREEMEVEDSEILAGPAGGERLAVEKDDLRVIFSRDARGALRVCLEGRGYSSRQLRDIGEQLIGRVAQQYAYHRIVTELKERQMTIVDEELTQDQSVRIRVRAW